MKKIQTVGVIGAGTIGLSWIAFYLSHQLTVYVYDVVDGYQERAKKRITEMLLSIGIEYTSVEDLLHLETDLATVVGKADWVQESGPENLDFKQEMFLELEKYAGKEVVLASSSSGIIASKIAEKMKDPSRVIVAHPFNPPHLIPLVEVSPGVKTTSETVEATMSFYQQLGKVPVLIHKEVPGFVANRLQVAIFQEAISLVRQGVVNVKELDQIMENSLGLRWASGGPFLSFHLGGGPAGLKGFLKHLGPSMNEGFKNVGQATLDEATTELLIQQTEAAYGTDLLALEKMRYEK